MHLVLDTSVMIDIERANKETIKKIEELKTRYTSHPKISFITYFELLEGIAKKSDKNKDRAKSFLELFEVINTTKLTAQNLALLRTKYSYPLPDLFIAAQVMESGGVLVTKDTDFKDIDEIDKIILEQ